MGETCDIPQDLEAGFWEPLYGKWRKWKVEEQFRVQKQGTDSETEI